LVHVVGQDTLTERACLKKNWRSGEDDIKMDIRKGKDTVKLIRMAQDKKTFRDFVNRATNFLVA